MADTIRSLFQKDIHRNINGVVQAGQVDEDSVYEELTEYVVTPEIAEALELVLAHYVQSLNTPTNKMGVWISGFFGSGKSHFLKILSYVLSRRTVHGRTTIDYFRDKDLPESLMALLAAASQSDTVPLLFNIDSESSTSGQRGQAIVDVLLKVFNRHLGYSSTLWIAEIERQLATAGHYEAFCQAFERIKGKSWQETREFLPMNRAPFLAATESIGMSPGDADFLLRSAQQGFDVSSKQLAAQLADYCHQQGPAFRLAFLIDEVGQYIAGDSRLMLNLQTVVEDIGTATRGQVWVIVTSQEQIDTVTNVKTEDFSKIQGRFATRINLSSINTDEVIKERLLAKQDWAQHALTSQYDQVEQSLKNVLTFGTDTPGYRVGYRSPEEFVASYPCVPYQFDLLQDIFEKVRIQGEAGKHLAHGERSLLNAFQEAVDAMGDAALGCLVPMSAFYETIESFLDSSIKNTIRRAALQRDNLTPRDVAVLKVLYLIKNIPGMPGTVDNVTTLLIDHVDTVKAALAREIQESLNRLVHEQLIQQNADQTYTFLSDEEQEVNREIQHTRLELGELDQQIGAVLFLKILEGQEKYRRGNRDFTFARRFEGRNYGTLNADLTVQFMTNTDSTEQRMKFLATENPGTLYGLIPPGEYSESFARALRIQRYVRNAIGATKDANRLRILQQKQLEAPSFIDQGETELRDALRGVVFYILGQAFRASGDFKIQLHEALDKLIQNTYPQLDYVTHPIDPKQASVQIHAWARNGKPASMVGFNDLALDAVIRYLERQQGMFARATMKDLRDTFSKPPYGWADVDIAGLVAVLLGMQRVRLSYNNEPLTADDAHLADRLMRGADQGKVVVELIVAMPPEERKRAASILREHFGYPADLEDSYEAVGKTIREQLEAKLRGPLDRIKEIWQTQNPTYPYPGSATLSMLEAMWLALPIAQGGKALVQAFIERHAEWANAVDGMDQLASFYLKSPRTRFDEAVAMLSQVDSDVKVATHYANVQSLYQRVKAILQSDEPYGDIPALPGLCNELDQALSAAAADERARNEKTITMIEETLYRLQQEHPEFEEKGRTVRDAVRAFREAPNLSLILANLGLARQSLEELQQTIRAATKPPATGKRTVRLRQVLHFPAHEGTMQIASADELTAYFEALKARCLEILASDGVIIIDPMED